MKKLKSLSDKIIVEYKRLLLKFKLSDGQLAVGVESASLLEAVSKTGFWFKSEAAARFKPEEYSSISRI